MRMHLNQLSGRFRKVALAFLTIAGLTLSGAVTSQEAENTNQPMPSAGLVEPADMVIWEGNIYTGEDDQPLVEAVVVKNKIIIYAGPRSGAEPYVGSETTVISLAGTTMFPGFVDAHAHLSGIGEREMTLNLEGINSVTSLQKSLSDWSDANPDAVVIDGRGWIETHWPEKRFPTRWDLDKIISDKPVLLTRADGHALVANSAALKAANITGDTKAPFGGEILKNALGEPTGILVDTAQSLVGGLYPERTHETLVKSIEKGGEVYAAYGWTGVHAMSVNWAEVPITEQLSDEGALKIRVYNSVTAEDAEQLFASGPRVSQSGRINTRAIKMYMDGALGSRGAALLEPYSDANTSGLFMMKPADALPIMRKALTDGFQINMHAIGDRGNRQVLDWFEQILSEVPSQNRAVSNPRWRIEHAQIIHPDDIDRFKNLNVIPSMQPSHAIGDFHFAGDRLSDSRLYGAYAWKTLINSGVIIAGGSDAPVERGDPRIEFYAAVSRKDMSGFQGPNWHAEEAVTRKEALKMFTIWPAAASFDEDKLGTIRVGKRADFTAFSTDLMVIPEEDILKSEVVLTIVDGEIAFARE